MKTVAFAPCALVSFDAGRIRIEGHAGQPPLVTDHPALVGWLMGFARPLDADAALQALPDGAVRETGARMLRYLLENGALAAEGDATTPAGPGSREQLSQLSRDVYDLGCDVAAFGPQAEVVISRNGGRAMADRLRAIRGQLLALRAELAQARGAYIAAQSDRIDATTPLKLHLGCGPYPLPGWVNVDVHPAPLSLNVLWGLPYPEGAASHVFMSHMLEHLFYPTDVDFVLREILRVLQPGGRARFVVPDIGACVDAYIRRDEGFFAARAEHWGEGDGEATPLEGFLAYAGAGPDPGWTFEAHKFGYDFETLRRALDRAGFADIRESAFMASDDAVLRVDEHSQVARATFGDRHYSLFVEATRPRA